MTRDTNGAVNLRSRSASVSRSYRSSLPSSLLRSLRSPSSAAPLSVHLRSRSVPRFTRHSRLRRVLREKKSVNEGPRSVVNRDRVTEGTTERGMNGHRSSVTSVACRVGPLSLVTSHPRFPRHFGSSFPLRAEPQA